MFFSRFIYRASRSAINPSLTKFRPFFTTLRLNTPSSEIKRTNYSSLVKKKHPDQGNSNESFIASAYDSLDENTAKNFDEKLPFLHTKLKKKVHPPRDNSNCFDFKDTPIACFEDLEKLLEPLDNSSYIQVLRSIGQEKLCNLLTTYHNMSVLIKNIPEDNREDFVNLIGREHIGKYLRLNDLFYWNLNFSWIKMYSKLAWEFQPISPAWTWREYKQFFEILGTDAFMNCLGEGMNSCPYSYQNGARFLSVLNSRFGSRACEELIDILGASIYTISHYKLCPIMGELSENKQKEILENFKPEYFKSEYKSLKDVRGMFSSLHSNNRQLFLNLIGKDRLDSLISLKDVREIFSLSNNRQLFSNLIIREHWESLIKDLNQEFADIIKKHEPEPEGSSLRSGSL